MKHQEVGKFTRKHGKEWFRVSVQDIHKIENPMFKQKSSLQLKNKIKCQQSYIND